jgi:hypothetical protein
MDKQVALDDSIARLEQSERRVENLRWRCDEAENASKRNAMDNSEAGQVECSCRPVA